MHSQDVVLRLEEKGIKPTANRILVYNTLAENERPQSLSDLEGLLVVMDKSSIFRVLALFEEADVVHTFTDGRGIIHYELCGSHGACSHDDGHVHFYCETCRQSFCLTEEQLPAVSLPEGYTQHSVSYVVKGECAKCRKRRGISE